MKIFKLEKSQVLPIPLEKAWEYFSNPLNLSEITPPELGLRIKGRFDGQTYNGMIIEYTVSPLLGIKMDWVSEIKHVNAPFSFVDEQRSGPYRFWYHQHQFQSMGDNQTRVMDTVYYALPLGIFANALDQLVVKGKLDGIFKYREEILRAKFQQR